MPRPGQPTVSSRPSGFSVFSAASWDAVARRLGVDQLGSSYRWTFEPPIGGSDEPFCFRVTVQGDGGPIMIRAALQASGVLRSAQDGSVVEVRTSPSSWTIITMFAVVAMAAWAGTIVSAHPLVGIFLMLFAVVLLVVEVAMLREVRQELEAAVVLACAEPETPVGVGRSAAMPDAMRRWPRYARVRFVNDQLESHGVRRGAVGYIVEVYEHAYEIEISDESGRTVFLGAVADANLVLAEPTGA